MKPYHYLRGYSIDTSGENCGEIRAIHTEGRVIKTEAREVADERDIAATAAVHKAHSGGDIDLLFERPVGNLHGNF